MPLNVPVFFTRLGSSVVFVAVMLTGLLWNEWSFLALVCLINFLCLREFFRLMQKVDKESYWPGWLPVVVQVTALLFFVLFTYSRFSSTVDDGGNNIEADDLNITKIQFPALILLTMILPLMSAIVSLICVLSKKTSLPAYFQSLGGVFYITLPMLLLLLLHYSAPYFPLIIILIIWSNDTMAYLVGSFFGRHLLSPVSPKKTWEGTIGGILVTVVAIGVVGYFLSKGKDASLAYPVSNWVGLALCVTIAGTFGDLFESKLKRMADVKDSGMLMPGHGGALDRFDSLLIATPFAFVYVVMFMR